MARNPYSGYDPDDYKDTDEFWKNLTQEIEMHPARFYKYFDWLEMLRKSGIVNMYGASLYLEKAFKLPHHRAATILIFWMQHYEELLEIREWKR